MRKERRKFERLKANPGAFVVFNSETTPCQIVDISEGGLAVLFVDKGDVLRNSFELALMIDDENLNVQHIPFEIINDFNVLRDRSLSGNDPVRRVGLKFGELTQTQKMQLEHFIWFATSEEM